MIEGINLYKDDWYSISNHTKTREQERVTHNAQQLLETLIINNNKPDYFDNLEAGVRSLQRKELIDNFKAIYMLH